MKQSRRLLSLPLALAMTLSVVATPIAALANDAFSMLFAYDGETDGNPLSLSYGEPSSIDPTRKIKLYATEADGDPADVTVLILPADASDGTVATANESNIMYIGQDELEKIKVADASGGGGGTLPEGFQFKLRGSDGLERGQLYAIKMGGTGIDTPTVAYFMTELFEAPIVNWDESSSSFYENSPSIVLPLGADSNQWVAAATANGEISISISDADTPTTTGTLQEKVPLSSLNKAFEIEGNDLLITTSCLVGLVEDLNETADPDFVAPYDITMKIEVPQYTDFTGKFRVKELQTAPALNIAEIAYNAQSFTIAATADGETAFEAWLTVFKDTFSDHSGVISTDAVAVDGGNVTGVTLDSNVITVTLDSTLSTGSHAVTIPSITGYEAATGSLTVKEDDSGPVTSSLTVAQIKTAFDAAIAGVQAAAADTDSGSVDFVNGADISKITEAYTLFNTIVVADYFGTGNDLEIPVVWSLGATDADYFKLSTTDDVTFGVSTKTFSEKTAAAVSLQAKITTTQISKDIGDTGNTTYVVDFPTTLQNNPYASYTFRRKADVKPVFGDFGGTATVADATDLENNPAGAADGITTDDTGSGGKSPEEKMEEIIEKALEAALGKPAADAIVNPAALSVSGDEQGPTIADVIVLRRAKMAIAAGKSAPVPANAKLHYTLADILKANANNQSN